MCLFHKHDWEIIDRITIEMWDADDPETKRPTGYKYTEVQRCKKCGKIRSQTIKY